MLVVLNPDMTVKAWHDAWQRDLVLSLDAYAGCAVVDVSYLGTVTDPKERKLQTGKPLRDDAVFTVVREAGAAS